MLKFLRKYQKWFFIVITAVIVITFSFFGTYSTVQNSFKKKEKVVSMAPGGKKIFQSQIDEMALFLSLENHFPSREEKRVNPFNDGVIRKDFLTTSIAALFVENFFDAMKEDLRSSAEQVKRFHFYTHPRLPFISAKEVWKELCPEMESTTEALKAEKEVSKETFTLLTKLYLQQEKMPPELLRRLLLYQQKQYSKGAIDEKLFYADLSLFGFHTLSDWLGKEFLHLASQFLLQVAAIAEEKGYKVSEEEAWQDLQKNAQNFFSQMRILSEASPIKVDEESCKHYFSLMGMKITEGIALWQKVLLFRKYFNDVGEAVFVDALPFKEFSSFSQETASIHLYRLPLALELKNFSQFLALQVYLKALCPDRQEASLELPKKYASLTEVEKKFPELVQKVFLLKVSEINIDKIALRIGEKQLLQWQFDKNHWKLLEKEFPFLATPSYDSDILFQKLESLEPSLRLRIDGFSRREIVKVHPEWIQEELNKAPKVQKELRLRLEGGNFPFAGISDRKAFANLLEKASLQKEKEKNNDPKDPLQFFSQDKNHYFCISVIQREKEKSFVSFAEAWEDGTLEGLVDRLLAKEYLTIREKMASQFQNKEGRWKSFHEVKEEVGREVFLPLLQAMDRDHRAHTKEKASWAMGRGPLEFYASHFFIQHMRKAQEFVRKDPRHAAWVYEEGNTAQVFSGKEEWKVQLETQEVTRSCKEGWLKKQAFLLLPFAWSEIHSEKNGEIFFFQLLKKAPKDNAFSQGMKKGKELLSQEAKRYLAKELFYEVGKNIHPSEGNKKIHPLP